MFLQGYFESLRMEVFDKNIGVTLVCPGPVVSNVVHNAFTENVNVVSYYLNMKLINILSFS